MTTLIVPISPRDQWCLYTHSLNGQLVYVGHCKLASLFDFPDAWLNEEWGKLIGGLKVMTLEILQIGPIFEITRARHILLNRHIRDGTLPLCNQRSFQPRRAHRPGTAITCSDGRTFATQEEAARGLGVQQSRISYHLARRPGYMHIRGLVLTRG